MELCNDVFSHIMKFAYNTPMTIDDFQKDIACVQDVRRSVPDFMLSSVVYDKKMRAWVCSPFKNFHPYHPTKNLLSRTFLNDEISFLPHLASRVYFVENKFYKGCFIRHIEKLLQLGFSNYNSVLMKYLRRMKPTHFETDCLVRQCFWQITHAEPLSLVSVQHLQRL